ncbi:MAG: efflux RND transporter periplasmic adaptor subunit [Fimbriimonadaceae bacterium]|nr:efflux RND transporter periplasmic adaptor subunit [Fimbriimonadaceae bacterium]QYK59619.1 MAG: efflux RND transporter periplasmic adaptor subunit [Fimbriimonadaceae bacterium]
MRGFAWIVPLALLGGCVNRAAQEQAAKTEALIKDPTIPVVTALATTRDLEETLAVTGAITTSDQSQVGPAVPGRLVAVYVKDGDQVVAGQVIAQQEGESLSAQLRQATAQANAARAAVSQARSDARTTPEKTAAAVRAAEARLSQAKSQLQKALNGARTEEREQAEWAVRRAKSDLDTAKSARDRAERLYQEGAIAQADFEQAQNRYMNSLAAYEGALQSLSIVQSATRPEDIESLRQDVRAAEESLRIAKTDRSADQIAADRLRSAEATLQAAEESVRIAQKSLRDTSIRSPFAGRVTGRPLQAGTFVAPGAVVATITGLQGSYFEASVPETRLADVSPGQRVKVTVDAVSGAVYTGAVIAVNPQANDVTRVYPVRISIDQRSERLKSGMFARGEISVGARKGATVVPSIAVLKDGQEATIVTVEAGKAKRIKVKVGIETNGLTEVSGIAPGTVVVTSGQSGLADETPVRVENGKEDREG